MRYTSAFIVNPLYREQLLYAPTLSETAPMNSRDRTGAEVALHNAFKAIEALIGEPPKNDEKFFAKLRLIGVNPDESVGYINKEPLHLAIRKMHEARDKKSAHGSTPRRAITYLELAGFQTLARYIVLQAIDQVIAGGLLVDSLSKKIDEGHKLLAMAVQRMGATILEERLR